ncbi:macro domain-containing protein [Sulfurospirillum multivorans]|uniref:ADP-ribose 1''-phosphate phophatase-like protein n=2 Tax=Sulfurospirillum multivorans TaxID=66821 RepID=A0AA86ANJ9_SULMK|nr:macro domain-containing protein [Sulfurospirillum multivorans]AHJ13794.1 ADP-ribose 1''-phosphate phophatase-like protein [Sulfurospirillum multivorans DSM 12446]QEH07284.1 ADP-ribose 1''-phosphate phophatase-like protein [Sulfurospirillum multivorans]
MIHYIQGNLFTSNAKVLVNTVNTVGVMGKGIAAEYKKIYPKMFEEYKRLCEDGTLDIGELHLYKTSNKWILNFPTKKHWKSPSQLEYIEKGLKKLIVQANKLQLADIAMPKLGCGNGGLDWDTQVKPIVEKYLKKAPINVSIYDFDKKIIPEHLKPKEIEEWLKSDPQTLTFSVFIEDLKSSIQDGLIEKELILNDTKYFIQYDDSNELFKFKSEDKAFVLSIEDLKSIFYSLKTLGKVCVNDLYTELQQNTYEIFDFIGLLSYILKNDDKIVLNYTKQQNNIEAFDFE